jgi:hypothetical protein
MRILRSTILAVGLMGLVACGGSSDSGDTTPAANPCAEENPCAENPCAENPCGEDMGDENPCAEGENPCGMGDENPCGEDMGDENPCG